MAPRFEMQKSPSGHYTFMLKTGSGRILLTSEPYRRRTGALNGIHAVKANAGRPEWFERRFAAEHQSYFVLTAANGQVIGCGELCSSKRVMERHIQSVMVLGPVAKVVDLTFH